MSNFINNAWIASWAFACWYIAGLGISLLLFPRRFRQEAFLLAPLMGMCALTLIGLFQITILFTPLFPRINICILAFISILTYAWLYRKDLKINGKVFCSQFFKFWLIPIGILFVYAWMFHNNGFHLLVGGSDQLQYSENARQILEEMNTHSARDLPVPHQDRFIYEMCTRVLPYLKDYRRGAEVLLATTTTATGLSFEETFPILILIALLTFGLVLGFLAEFFFLSTPSILILQTALLSSFYLLEAHIQGSLALIISLAPNLVGLAMISRLAMTSSWRWILLSAIITATYISIYSEPALINILLPSIILCGWGFKSSIANGFSALGRLVMVLIIICLCAPFAVSSVISNLIVNCNPVYLQFHQSHHAIFHLTSIFKTSTPQWSNASVILGSNSYYDISAFNNYINQLIAKVPYIGHLGFLLLCSLGVLGYFKTKNRLAFAFAFILLCWTLLSHFLASNQDYLRFSRSIQYAMPFAIIGLVCLASQQQKFQSVFWKTLMWIGRIVLVIFMIMNISTVIRTIHFITSHDTTNDPILLRFNEHDTQWQLLKKELNLSASENRPVLFSGFKETIRPTAIAIILRTQPQVLGNSILSFWPLYTVFYNRTWSDFNTHLTKDELLIAQQNESKPWQHLQSHWIEIAEQAVVPIGGDYPAEWKESKDVYAARVQHFPNICDVIYRNEYSVSLPSHMTSQLMKDKAGSYRVVLISGPVIIHDRDKSHQQLTVVYEGNANDVQLLINNKIYKSKKITRSNDMQISARINPEDGDKVHLNIHHQVKLRFLGWNTAIS